MITVNPWLRPIVVDAGGNVGASSLEEARGHFMYCDSCGKSLDEDEGIPVGNRGEADTECEECVDLAGKIIRAKAQAMRADK